MKRDLLIELRAKRSQNKMATIYGVTQQAWSMWELGINAPTPSMMKRLAIDIGKPMEEIFFDVFNNHKS